MRFFVLLLCFLTFSFAFYPVYYSPADWLNRSFPTSFFSNTNFSGRFAQTYLGLLISQRGALYFKHTDGRYDSFNNGYPFNDYFLEKYNFYSPISAFEYVSILVPEHLTYGSIFADSENGNLGVLMSFSTPTTLEQIDNSCLRPVGAVYEHYDGILYYDGGDSYYNSPLIMNSGDEPCDYQFQGTYSLSKNKKVQVLNISFWDKISEPCPVNHIFRAKTEGTISCEPCQKNEYADVFRNACVAKIDNILNPYDYARAQCSSKGSSLKYIQNVLGIVNGGENYQCLTVCDNGEKYANYNCPERIDFENETYTPECLKGTCLNLNYPLGNENTSSNFNSFLPPVEDNKNLELNSAKDNENLELKNTKDNEICVGDTDKCFNFGDSKSKAGICSTDDTGKKECFELGSKEGSKGNELCIDDKCFTIGKGSANNSNTFCVDGECFNVGDNSKFKDNKICVDGQCSSFSSVNNGSLDNANLSSGDSQKNNSFTSNSSSNLQDNNGDLNSNNNGLEGLCENGECGSYDNSSFNSFLSKMQGLLDDLGSFKENLGGTYDNFKESVENTKRVFDSGFLNFKNSSFLNSCPLVFDYQITNGINQKVEIDFCNFLSSYSNLFYLIFYIFFSAIALIFSYRILKDVFNLILRSRSS